MKRNRLGFFWVGLVLIAVVLAVFLGITPVARLWVLPLLLIMILFSAATFVSPNFVSTAAKALQKLRARPIVYWLLLLVWIGGLLAVWVIAYQPTNGRWLIAEEYLQLILLVWGCIILFSYETSRDEVRAMGAKLSKSKLSGVMVTVTMLLTLFVFGEAALRIFYVTTDAYTFTSMNYYWYENFYYPTLNSLGFRDHEPSDDNTNVRIGVLGDSFTVGQGVNNLDDTFPQVLERSLGSGFDVNVIAKSGWDSDIHLVGLQQYPYQPNIVVLSYYLNDIDWLLEDTPFNPNANFSFPQNPLAAWFVRTFFAPNYIYYNVLQYTSGGRTQDFATDLVSAHLDETIWAQQAQMLDNIAWWTREHEMRLVVLIWPQLAAIDASVPATTRVADFFRAQGVEVVDLTDKLRQYPTTRLIVNNFDTHPGVLAQQIAAEQLYPVILRDTEG